MVFLENYRVSLAEKGGEGRGSVGGGGEVNAGGWAHVSVFATSDPSS